MADLVVSVLLLAGIVLVSEVFRRTVTKLFAKTDYCTYMVELISTFQLCACTHELKVLGEVGREHQQIGLTLTYFLSVVHAVTFHGAIGNPSGTLEHMYRKRLTGRSALGRIACQFVAAVVARVAVPYMWAFGLSDVHLTHKLLGFRCISPIHAPLAKAAAVELGCAFAMHTAASQMHGVDEKYRVHAIAAVITTLVYAGGSVTGAVFNPALAFSTQFPCSGSTFIEYSLVYWLGPIMGMASSVLLLDKVVPGFTRKSLSDDLISSAVKRKKIK